MQRFELDVLAADTRERTIEGVIIPYGEVASVQGRRYRFARDAATLARPRTPLLLDHDRSKPVGVLAEFEQTDAGAFARFKIDATAAGDDALATAASGSRGAFSIGAELDELDESGDVAEVKAARIAEVSLLPIGAFAGAAVTRVAAAGEEPEPDPEPDPDQLPLDPEPEPAPPATPDPEEGTTMTEAAAAPPVILAARSDPPRLELRAGELVPLIVRAQHGEPDARRYLEAALAESISTDVSGLLPPQYETTILGGMETPRPLYTVFRGRPLPGVGLVINKPRWTTRPNGAWAASVDADATTSTVTIGSDAANVERWDWAGAIPWVVVQRSSPDVVDAIYAEAIEDFHFDVETRIAALLTAGAATADDTLGAGIGAFYGATNRNPDVILVSPDVWGFMADAGALAAQVAAGPVSTAEGLRSSYAGIPIVAVPTFPPLTRILATRRALDVRITEPVRLTANAIGALNVELAVVGEGLFDVDYAPEIVELTTTAPAVAAELAAQKKK